ncbi:uncharacterized protein LOC123511582 [Portunus trituberculatus]|uniref:uncharacterized protein LOC123511582 n=1 Tax=Portunus trituberculatus TaxID=210409 RepID=UPI001E1CB77A|nr:uncharacterized protein LOC123511582 [Portunus trituberculatus]
MTDPLKRFGFHDLDCSQLPLLLPLLKGCSGCIPLLAESNRGVLPTIPVLLQQTGLCCCGRLGATFCRLASPSSEELYLARTSTLSAISHLCPVDTPCHPERE